MLVDWLILGAIGIIGVALHKNITKARYTLIELQEDVANIRYRLENFEVPNFESEIRDIRSNVESIEYLYRLEKG